MEPLYTATWTSHLIVKINRFFRPHNILNVKHFTGEFITVSHMIFVSHKNQRENERANFSFLASSYYNFWAFFRRYYRFLDIFNKFQLYVCSYKQFVAAFSFDLQFVGARGCLWSFPLIFACFLRHILRKYAIVLSFSMRQHLNKLHIFDFISNLASYHENRMRNSMMVRWKWTSLHLRAKMNSKIFTTFWISLRGPYESK